MKRLLIAAAVLAVFAAQPALADGPAVDAVNAKISGGYGTLGSSSLYFGSGSLDVPLGDSFGLQADVLAGGIHNIGVYGGGAHLFWRDPSRALVGLYADETHFDLLGGVNIEHIAAEAEWYTGNVTLRGLAGWEGGDIANRFFDRADVVWYPSSDLSLSIGHRYSGGTNAAAAEVQYQFPGSNFALFAQGRLGEHNTNGIWGGVTIFFGSGKSLMDRSRQDDPASDPPDSLAGSASIPRPPKVCPFSGVQNASFCCPPGTLCIHH